MFVEQVGLGKDVAGLAVANSFRSTGDLFVSRGDGQNMLTAKWQRLGSRLNRLGYFPFAAGDT